MLNLAKAVTKVGRLAIKTFGPKANCPCLDDPQVYNPQSVSAMECERPAATDNNVNGVWPLEFNPKNSSTGLGWEYRDIDEL